MEAIEEAEANRFDDLGHCRRIMRELREEKSLRFISPEAAESKRDARHESVVNRLIAAVYSGPTIGDVESALTLTTFTNGDAAGRCSSRSTVCPPDKGQGKMEHKYTLRLKICGVGLADDGYKWRKYGQKSIKNSPNPRSFLMPPEFFPPRSVLVLSLGSSDQIQAKLYAFFANKNMTHFIFFHRKMSSFA
ncbi:WRKY [Musa troglodytarum]|uniref:WRKY n=1 Tax=Musa troglodytarum TaxID=320322 RepID=A0A9E7H7V8_9LILI|nr:WRKY [Musa troglodytarum]